MYEKAVDREMSQRHQRTRKAPVPLYVPDENVKMEDDFDDEEDEDVSGVDEEGDECSDSDVSYSGSEANEYEFDDFLVPDHVSVVASDDEAEESADDDDSCDSDDDDSEDDDSEDDSDIDMAAPEEITTNAVSEVVQHVQHEE